MSEVDPILSNIFCEYISMFLEYSAYRQIVTIHIVTKKRNEFSSLVVYLVDSFRKFPKKIAKRNDLVVGTVPCVKIDTQFTNIFLMIYL